MGFEQIYNLVAGNIIAGVFVILYYIERKDRKLAERRYRTVLREVADMPPEILDDTTNGGE